MPKTKLPRVVQPPLDRRDPVGNRIIKDNVALIRRVERLRDEVLREVNNPDAYLMVLRGSVARLFEEAHRELCALAELPRTPTSPVESPVDDNVRPAR